CSMTMHPIIFPDIRRSPMSTLFPYTTLFRSRPGVEDDAGGEPVAEGVAEPREVAGVAGTRRSRLDRSHSSGVCSVSRSRKGVRRSEEHTSELQSRENLVCRLLLEKKKNIEFL